MILAAHQPNFLPWLGYFYKISKSDTFVILDNVQYVKNSVANRTYIAGKIEFAQYLTVPVYSAKGSEQKYNEIEIFEPHRWYKKALNTIHHAYVKAPYFEKIFPSISHILKNEYLILSDLNISLINFVVDYLNLPHKCVLSSNLTIPSAKKQDRIIEICKNMNASTYLSGKGAKSYSSELDFNSNGIKLVYTKYTISDKYRSANKNGELVNLSILHFLMNFPSEKIINLINCEGITNHD